MPPITETPAPVASAGLVARLAAHLGLSAPPEASPTAELDKLTASLAQLSSEYQAAQVTVTELSAKLDGITAELASAAAERDAANAVVAAIEALVPNSTAPGSNPAEAIAAAVSKQSADNIAASGFPPEQAPAVNNQAETEDTLSRSDFAKLTADKQMAFVQAKGKITE